MCRHVRYNLSYLPVVCVSSANVEHLFVCVFIAMSLMPRRSICCLDVLTVSVLSRVCVFVYESVCIVCLCKKRLAIVIFSDTPFSLCSLIHWLC